MYANATDLDQIATLNERRITERRNQAFIAKMTSESEEAKESNLIQTFMVSASGADKSVIEKLIQTVST